MKGFTVELRGDGLFEAKPLHVGRRAIRVTHDSSGRDVSRPWTALGVDETGVRWAPIHSFEYLDDALDCAVMEAARLSEVPEYEVLLPDGVSFIRPGRVPLEQAMASAGWFYVNAYIGFLMVTTSKHENAFDALNEVRQICEGTCAVIGTAELSDEDDDGRHWCVDLSIANEGFVHASKIPTEALIAFKAEGLPVIPHFDYRTRSSVAVHDAQIIEFPQDRIIRMPANLDIGGSFLHHHA